MDPKNIAKLISEDIKINNGLIFEEVESTDPLDDLNPHDIEQHAVSGESWKLRTQDALGKARQVEGDVESKLNNLIAVHLTNYFPQNGVISPTGRYHSPKDEEFEDNLEHDNIDLDHFGRPKADSSSPMDVAPRETIHFTLNGPVASHMQGDWSDKKVAILIPADILADRWVNLNPVDSWVMGELKLPSGTDIIAQKSIVPQDFKEQGGIKLFVVPDGSDMSKLAEKRIKARGYTVRAIGDHGWGGTGLGDKRGAIDYTGADRASGLKHTDTVWSKMEEDLMQMYEHLLLMKKNLNSGDYASYQFEKVNTIKKNINELNKLAKTPEEREAFNNILKKYKYVMSNYDKMNLIGSVMHLEKSLSKLTNPTKEQLDWYQERIQAMQDEIESKSIESGKLQQKLDRLINKVNQYTETEESEEVSEREDAA